MTTTTNAKKQPAPPRAKGRYKLWVLFINHTASGGRPVIQFYHKLQRLFLQVNQKWSGQVHVAQVYDTTTGQLIWKYNLEDGWENQTIQQQPASAPTA